MARTASAKSATKPAGRKRAPLPSTLDETLSQAQQVLRDGHHDHLSRAIATARDRLNGVEIPTVTTVVLGPVDGVPVAAPCILSGCHYRLFAERSVQAIKFQKALQQIMQVLGPSGVPDGVDYGDEGNLAGLSYEVDEVLRICRSVGIEYKSRSVLKRENVMQGKPMMEGVRLTSPLSRYVQQKAFKVMETTPPSQRAAVRTAFAQLERLLMKTS